MPSTILSDNGASSGTAGIKTTGSNDGQLALQTTTAGGTATTALTIDTSQNVGIGTSSVSVPSGKALEVYDATVPRIKLTNSTTGTTSTDGCEINVSGSDFNVTNREAGNTIFNVNGAERMRIDSSGNVGIGTNSPLQRLHVETVGGSTAINALPLVTNNSNTSTLNRRSGILMRTVTSASAEIVTAVYAEKNTSDTAVMGFATNNTERMRIDSSGNVGIGTSSPASLRGGGLTLGTSSAGKTLTLYSSSDGANGLIHFIDSNGANAFQIGTGTGSIYLYGYGARPMSFYTNDTERMRITSDGEVLVGGTTAMPEIFTGLGSAGLQIQKNVGGSLAFFRDDTTVSGGNNFGVIGFFGNDTTSNNPTLHAYIGAEASGTHAAGDNPTDIVFGCTNDGSGTVAEFARLGQEGVSGRKFQIQQATLTDGNLVYFYARAGTAGTLNREGYIGVYKHAGITNSCGYSGFTAEDGANNYLWADNSDILRISTTATNIGTTGGTVVGTQTSDERIKNIIGPVTYGLEQIKSINPVEFTLKDDAEQTKRIGFIAQQVQPIVPESVYDTKEVIVEGEPTKLGMEYVALIPVLVNAVKELSAKCDALQAEVNQLKGAQNG